MKRRQVTPAPPPGRPTASPPPPARVRTRTIPLPQSHIRRTPSEARLADEVRRAEADDARLYSRLVAGMREQMLRRGGGGQAPVHPLSESSLRGVVRARHARDDDEDDWKLGDVEEDDGGASFVEGRGEGPAYSPWSTPARRSSAKSDSDGSLLTRGFMKDQEEEDDDCVFSLDL